MEQPLTSKPSLFGMIWSPGEQFDRIRERPKFWGALIIVTLLMTVVSIVTVMATPDEVYQMGAGIQLSADELQMAKVFAIVVAGIGGFIGTPVGILISAAIMLLIATLAHTGANFRQMLSLNAYITFIGMIGALLNAVVHLVIGGDPSVVVTGLNSLVQQEGTIGGLLNGIEVFSIWTTILTAIGLHKVAGLSKGLSWAVAIIFFIIGLAFALIGGAFSGLDGV